MQTQVQKKYFFKEIKTLLENKLFVYYHFEILLQLEMNQLSMEKFHGLYDCIMEGGKKVSLQVNKRAN